MPGKPSKCHSRGRTMTGNTVDNASQIFRFIQFVYQSNNYYITLLIWFAFFKTHDLFIPMEKYKDL